MGRQQTLNCHGSGRMMDLCGLGQTQFLESFACAPFSKEGSTISPSCQSASCASLLGVGSPEHSCWALSAAQVWQIQLDPHGNLPGVLPGPPWALAAPPSTRNHLLQHHLPKKCRASLQQHPLPRATCGSARLLPNTFLFKSPD